MRKLSIGLVAILMAITGFTSCNQENELNSVAPKAKTINNKVTVEEAKANALDFVNKLNQSNTRAFSSKDLTIANVKPVSFKGKTRAGSSLYTDTLFYIVNFSDSCGFAIASANKNETPILALIEDGNYDYNENDSLNPGFEAFMDAMIEREVNGQLHYTVMPKDDFAEGGGGSSNYRPDKFEVMSPLLKTKWNQWSPYNTYCSNCPTGCVITAVSQICSYLQTPRNIRYQYNSEFGQATMDWEKINNECSLYNIGAPRSADTQEQVARMMRFWGITFGAKYSSNSTSADTGDAVNKMRKDLGFNATGLSDYNIDNVIKDLKCGNKIILMRGNGRYYHVGFVFKKYVDGHAWVVDGYIDQIKNNKESKYVHCNWGWGPYSYNGYFLSNALNAEEAPVFNDNAETTRASHNYRYKLKTATFTK